MYLELDVFLGIKKWIVKKNLATKIAPEQKRWSVKVGEELVMPIGTRITQGFVSMLIESVSSSARMKEAPS